MVEDPRGSFVTFKDYRKIEAALERLCYDSCCTEVCALEGCIYTPMKALLRPGWQKRVERSINGQP